MAAFCAFFQGISPVAGVRRIQYRLSGKIHMQTYVTAKGMDWLASFDVEDAFKLEVVA